MHNKSDIYMRLPSGEEGLHSTCTVLDGVRALHRKCDHRAHFPKPHTTRVVSGSKGRPTLSGVVCQASDVRCQMSGVRCQVSDVRCQISGMNLFFFHTVSAHTKNILAEVFFPANMLTYVKTCNMMHFKFSLPRVWGVVTCHVS